MQLGGRSVRPTKPTAPMPNVDAFATRSLRLPVQLFSILLSPLRQVVPRLYCETQECQQKQRQGHRFTVNGDVTAGHVTARVGREAQRKNK